MSPVPLTITSPFFITHFVPFLTLFSPCRKSFSFLVLAFVLRHSNPLCFFGLSNDISPDDDEFRNTLLTATMTEGDFRRLVALNVGLYLKMLNLPAGVKRNADMVNSWILSGCTLWIRVAGGRDVPSVATDGIFRDLLSEFEPDARGVYSQENALRKAAPDGMLTEQDFMDWYVICKYTDAIIPPEDSGYPVFKVTHHTPFSEQAYPFHTHTSD